MNHIKLGAVTVERYLLYGLILSMATYAIPFMRIGSEELAFPLGGLFIPLSCFLLLIRILSSHRFTHHNVLVFSLLLLYFSIPLASFFSVTIAMDRIVKLSIFIILPILFTNVLNNDRSLSISLYLIIAVGLVLAIYGFYGYFSGNVGEETEGGWGLSTAR